MTTIDWKALKPHVPLGPGDAQYVERTGSAGEEIAQWILAGDSPLVIGGPAGVGKSTELARAAELLQPHRAVCLVQLDRFENMRCLTSERMLLRVASSLGAVAADALHLSLSEALGHRLVEARSELQGKWTTAFPPADLVNAAAAEIGRLSRRGGVIVLIDGLEKVPPGAESLNLFDGLASIAEEVGLVLTIPWHAAFGPQAETVVRVGERFVAVRAVDVQGESGEAGRAFLRKVLAQRLGWDEAALDETKRGLVDEAIRWSGGIPRTFLQLMAGAGTYAKLRREAPWPTEEDLGDARADHIDSIARLLIPGDESAIRGAVGTTGRELDLGRKVRLMAHGFLLERARDGSTVLELSPLAQVALDQGGRHA